MNAWQIKAVNNFPCGETTRVQLALLLLQNPDILILDEPTNHLDLQELMWLENWLNNYPKAILYVSHDRVFIDNTASKIIELEKGKSCLSEKAIMKALPRTNRNCRNTS